MARAPRKGRRRVRDETLGNPHVDGSGSVPGEPSIPGRVAQNRSFGRAVPASGRIERAAMSRLEKYFLTPTHSGFINNMSQLIGLAPIVNASEGGSNRWLECRPELRWSEGVG